MIDSDNIKGDYIIELFDNAGVVPCFHTMCSYAKTIIDERNRLKEALIWSIYMRCPYVKNKTGDLIKDGLREHMNQMEIEALKYE